MMKRLLHFFWVGLLLACGQETIDLNQSFTRIFDDSNPDIRYRPEAFVEVADGFILLSGWELDASDFMGIELVKTDNEGNFVNRTQQEEFVVPIGPLFLVQDSIYFFGMNPTTLQAVILGYDQDLNFLSQTPVAGTSYPLASSLLPDGGFLLLSYDALNLNTVLSEVSLNGNLVRSRGYSIGPGTDVQVNIINHYLRASERPLPFFCGALLNGTLYFNGFYNYSFSLVFTTMGENPTRVIQGQSSNAGVRALLPLTGGSFALAGFQFEANFLRPSVTLNETGISSSVNFFTGDLSELRSYTPVKITSYVLGNNNLTAFAAETESRQIVVYFFDTQTGDIKGVHYLGYLNAFTLADLTLTHDNGLAIMGTTYVAGRFERIYLNKISEREIKKIIK